jgi:hypothetical protein
MRELSSTEVFEVGGGVLQFTTPITMSLLNNVASATTVGTWLSASFSAGYFIGTYLNRKYDLSTKIVDAISG